MARFLVPKGLQTRWRRHAPALIPVLAVAAVLWAMNDGWSGLHWAVRCAPPQFVSVLLRRGADANADGWDGVTPLHLAARFGKAETARLLLAAGANPNPRAGNPEAWDQETPLHEAAARGHLQVAAVLLAGGADVNAPDSDGWTPMHWAFRNDDAEMIALLRTHGAAAVHVLPPKHYGPPPDRW